MKKILLFLILLALPMALFLALAGAGIPSTAHADEAAASDASFLDGNWFDIAAAKGEAYKAGSPTNVALEAQLSLYQTAVDNDNTADAEKYAIRSWVKANYAMELGRQSLESRDYEAAAAHLKRALKYAKAAQKKGAGRGEQEDRVCDDTAPAWRGCSEIEGKRAEARIKALQKRLPKEYRGTEGQ